MTKSGLNPADFKGEIGGKSVELFVLTNKKGAEICITNFGGFVASIMVPDKNGKLTDVVLGHQSLTDYQSTPEPYLGSAVGRYGNRIAKGEFTLGGTTYNLAINNGPNNLHGGKEGFNKKVWDAKLIDGQTLQLTCISPDGEEGFPGTLSTKITYRLTDENALHIEYNAFTDKTTLCNLTNHSFFNLSGQGEPTVEDHTLRIDADFFTPMDDVSIPTGEIRPTAGTPMSFVEESVIGSQINDNYDQLAFGKGYDHCYVVRRKTAGELVLCAKARSPKTGIVLETYTTAPGVQLYTGNWLGGFEGKNEAKYPERSAFCLETQHFPDTPNKGHFPSCALHPGETYHHTCIYKFSVEA